MLGFLLWWNFNVFHPLLTFRMALLPVLVAPSVTNLMWYVSCSAMVGIAGSAAWRIESRRREMNDDEEEEEGDEGEEGLGEEGEGDEGAMVIEVVVVVLW